MMKLFEQKKSNLEKQEIGKAIENSLAVRQPVKIAVYQSAEIKNSSEMYVINCINHVSKEEPSTMISIFMVKSPLIYKVKNEVILSRKT